MGFCYMTYKDVASSEGGDIKKVLEMNKDVSIYLFG